VAGKLLLAGSPTEGSVTAWDTESGAERWKFLAEGPVRFAPVACQGRVLFGCDDGYLYALAAADGKLLWKVRVAPDDRPQRRHLGNGRLISFWPVRGGPVLAGDTLYCAAGIWPTMGVFAVALDARSGAVVWRNDTLGFLESVRLDHNDLHPSGLSPQGYLAIEGETLLVPNGRSMPAGLELRTGKLRYYVQGYRNGDCHVTAMGNYALVGLAGVVDLRTGREVGSRWAAAGRDAPAKFDVRKMQLFEGPFYPYKLFSGCSWRSVLADGVAYDLAQGTFTAYDLAQARLSEYESHFDGRVAKPWRWDAPAVWKLPTALAARKAADSAVVRAGGRLYGHTAGTLLAVELPAPGGTPRICWKQPLPGTPSALVAADDKLFAVTREGTIACFASGNRSAKDYPLETVPLRSADDASGPRATELLQQANVGEGYCVLLGLGSGRLASELLLREPKLKLIAVDADPEKVNHFRRTLIAAGWYGRRAEAFVGRPWEFPRPAYLASLMVCEDPDASGFSAERPAGEIFEQLRPYGGVLAVPAERGQSLQRWASAAALEGAQLQHAGQFALLRRVGPLPDTAAWTHECADAARSYYSHDRRVRPPFAILWYGDGDDYGFWKEKDYGTGVKPQVIGGRLFALQVSRRQLCAYDAYTGRQLWNAKTAGFTRYASLADGIYVAGDNRLTVYDPARGEKRGEFTFASQPGRKDLVSDVRVSDAVVLIATAAEKSRKIEEGLWDSTALVALDRRSGAQLWARPARQRFNNHALAMGAGLVLAIDSVSPARLNEAVRHGEAQALPPSTLLALDERTGATRWSVALGSDAPPRGFTSWLSIRSSDDWLAYVRELNLVLAGKYRSTRALEAGSGREVWRQALGGQPLILRGDTFLNQAAQTFDARSGKLLDTPVKSTRGGCNYAVANEFCIFVRDHSASYIDLVTWRKQDLYAIRSGCSNSLVAADGLLNVPNFAVGCVCNYPIQTCFAMIHQPEAGDWIAH
jgi:outer membrane protein assembly factor BamB